MLSLMVDKLVKRKQKEVDAMNGRLPGNAIPEDQFFKQVGIKVKHGN